MNMLASETSATHGMLNVIAAAPTDAAHEPWTSHDTVVLIVAAVGIAIVVLLIVWLKMHAFLALTIGALFVGIGSGIALDKVTLSYQVGVGGVLGYVGVLIALGAMLGKLLADSGGADKVVDTLLRGRPATLPWKMALIAAIIGIPMFFEIGLVLLIPVVMLAVHRSKAPAMRLGIPALAGLSVLHGFVPPHPGPLAAIGILHANVGITLAFGLVIAIPTVIVAGPLFGRAGRADGPDRGGRRRLRRRRYLDATDPTISGRRFNKSPGDQKAQDPTRDPQPHLHLDAHHAPVAARADADQGGSGPLDARRTRRAARCWTSSATRSSPC